MYYILRRLISKPFLFGNILVTSLFVNLLGLASSLYVIQVFNRYLGYGTDATLHTLTIGMILAILAELAFRMIRYRFVSSMNIVPEFLYAQNLTHFLTQVRLDNLSGNNEKLPKDSQRYLDIIQNALNPTNITTILDAPFALTFVIAVFLLSPTLGFVLTSILAVGMILSYFGKKNLAKQVPSVNKANEDLQQINSSATILDTVHSFNARKFIGSKWQEKFAVFTIFKQKNQNTNNAMQAFSQTLGMVLSMMIIFFGAQEVISGNLSIGALIGCNIISSRAFANLSRMMALNQTFAQADFAAKKLENFMSLPVEKSQGTRLQTYSGRISFANLSYRPPFSPSALFENLSLNIDPGSLVYIVGSNSTGKTSLARIILGLISPSAGQILVRDVDLRQIIAENWRSKISYLPQEPQFLNASIRDNILVNANSETSDKQILDLFERCDLGVFIRNTSNGLAHPMTNDSLEFSLGIKRRLALARALINDGQLVIIDEPFASLDKGGQDMMTRVIKELINDKKTLIICDHDTKESPKPDFIIDLNHKPKPRITSKS